MMFGKERFQAILNEWLTSIKELSNKQSTNFDYHSKLVEYKKENKSMLKIFEQVTNILKNHLKIT